MYENGRQINRYANKTMHKNKMKCRYLRGYYWARSWNGWEDYIAHKREHDGTNYWKLYGRNGRRRYAAWCSRRKVRAEFRNDVAKLDYDDMWLPERGLYKKIFDYAWTVW